MKKKLVSMLITALLLTTATGCRNLAVSGNNNILVEPETVESDSVRYDEEGNPLELVSANGEVFDLTSDSVVVKKDANGKVVSVTSEIVKEERKETASEKTDKKETVSAEPKKTEKTTGKVVTDSGKTDAKTSVASTEKTTMTAVQKTGTQTQENGQIAVNGDTQSANKGTVVNSTQNTQTVSNTTTAGKTVAENKVQPETNNTVPQTTTQQTTQTQPQNSNVQTSTTADISDTKPMPGTPEFDAMIKSWEEQIAAENNQPQQISSSDNQKLLDDINAYRAENGLNPLTWSDELGEQANTRAREQTDNVVNNDGLIDHGYGTPTDANENLSSRHGDAVLEGWQNSPGHNNTLLDPNATTAGVATGNAGDGEGNGVTVLLIE